MRFQALHALAPLDAVDGWAQRHRTRIAQGKGSSRSRARRSGRPPSVKSHSGVVSNESQLRKATGNRAFRNRLAIIRFDLEDLSTLSCDRGHELECPLNVAIARPREARSIAFRATR